MKIKVAVIIFFTPCVLWAQGSFDLLKNELKHSNTKDTVIVWGINCIECNGVSQNRYYIINKGLNTKTISIIDDFGKSKKVFDSVFVCNDCKPIFNFACQNYKSIDKDVQSSFYILTIIKDTNGKTYYSMPTTGECFFVGVCIGNDFTYMNISKGDINKLFYEANNLWVLISLLRNQFGFE